MKRRILIVDDEPQIRTILRGYFVADGFDVVEAGSGAEALQLAGEGVDLVLLDVGLRHRRPAGADHPRQSSDVYVILVTARAEEVDKLVGLSVGADDYITKPFSPREVVARVRTILRRPRNDDQAPASEGVLAFDGLVIDEPRRTLTVEGREVTLTSLEFDLLVALAQSPGRVFSRTQLLEKVWGYDFYGDERVVDVHIRNMRKMLGDDASNPHVIGTVRGVGYRLLLEPRKGSR